VSEAALLSRGAMTYCCTFWRCAKWQSSSCRVSTVQSLDGALLRIPLLQGSMRHLLLLVRDVTAPHDKHAPSCRRATRPFVLAQIERDEQLLTFQSYMNRVRTPYEQSFSTNPLYYSLDVGPIHIIMLNSVRRCAALASVLSEAQVQQSCRGWYHDLESTFAPFDKCRRAHGILSLSACALCGCCRIPGAVLHMHVLRLRPGSVLACRLIQTYQSQSHAGP